MTELETIQRAKMYIDKMANGIDPLTDQPVRDDDMINQVRISRCLFFVSDVLRRVIGNGGVVTKAKKKKEAFHLSDEQLSRFYFSDVPIPISEITKRFNALSEDGDCIQLKHTQLTGWLIEIGALQSIALSEGKTTKTPTEIGANLGIITEQRTGQYGNYTVVLYNRDAQQFLVDHLPVIIEKGMRKNDDSEYRGQPWTKDQEDCLIDLFKKDVPLSEIAITLKRTENGIKARLRSLDLMN